jgi:hypothetical protein
MRLSQDWQTAPQVKFMLNLLNYIAYPRGVAEFLQNRGFQGLETRIGRDMPSVLEQGRTGIAKGYEDDRH